MAVEDRIRLPTLNLIHRRQRLLNMLTEFVAAGSRLITIYAPGGYGKSILLADFAQTTDLPVCWCSLEPADRDPTAFLTLFAQSMTDRFHEIELDTLLELVQQGDTQASVRRIAGLLADVGPHIIMLDDYHKAVSAGLTLTLNRLLEQLPPTSTMVIAARSNTSLEASRIINLLTTERATGLSEETLRFTPEELQRVMCKRFGRQLALTEAEGIVRVTAGNIARMLLVGHLIIHVNGMVNSLSQRLNDDSTAMYDYLAEAVLDKQPPELQRFLLRTAVLPDMTADVCNELLEISDTQVCLEELVRKDLFVTQVGMSFRYHDLFAEFLRTRLVEDKEQHRQISIRAGNLLAARGRFEEAMTLYLSVQAWDETVALLETQGEIFFNTGRALTLNDWLSRIPEQALIQHPRLLWLHGRILSNYTGEHHAALTCFQRAEKQFLKQDDLMGAAKAQVCQSINLVYIGRTKESLALLTKTLEHLQALEATDEIIAWAIKIRGLIYWNMGNIVGALSDGRRALELYEKLGDSYNVGICHHNVGICLATLGNISGAGHHYQQAVRIWEAWGNDNEMANTLNSLGVSLYNVGRYDQALQQFRIALELALQIGSVQRAAYILAGMGDVYLTRHEYEPAVAAYERAMEFARPTDLRKMEVYNMVKLGECSFQQEALAEALHLAEQARELAIAADLSLEKGLACALQAKIRVRQGEYEAGFDLFAEALAAFAQNDVLEQARTRLWWGYSLLLDAKATAALAQLQAVLSLVLTMGELVSGLGPTIAETQPLLLHFLDCADIPASVRDDIQFLLKQQQQGFDRSQPGLGPGLLAEGFRS
jgi:LuxR family maltose regulon positive regulatory protein